jgi:CorA-like Mg2+ transporter protein
VPTWIDHAGNVTEEPSPSLVAELVQAGQPFWLDIENPTDEVIDRLAARLGLHPLAVEDSKQFDQRGKLQVYGNVAMIVSFGLDAQLRDPVEVHCYYTTGFLIAPRIEAMLPAGARARQLAVRTLLAGMCLAQAGHRPAHLTRVHQALISLPDDDRVRLGVLADWKHGPHLLTCRQTERTFGLVADALAGDEPGALPSGRLRSFCDDLPEASIPQKSKDASTSLAVDTTSRGWCRLMGLAPLMLFTTTLLIVRNQRIPTAWNTRQAENRRRAAPENPQTPPQDPRRPRHKTTLTRHHQNREPAPHH